MDEAKIRETAVAIILENAKWAEQRGMHFVARERRKHAEQIAGGASFDLELRRDALARMGDQFDEVV